MTDRLALSNRQYPMLKMFNELPVGKHMKIEEAQMWDQRPFRSMLIRQWVAFTPGRGFAITKKGREAYRRFFGTDIARKNASLPLTSYFDPTTYGLGSRKPKDKAKDKAKELRIAAA